MSRTRLLWAFVPVTTSIHRRGGKCGQRYRLKNTVWKTDKQQKPHDDKGRLDNQRLRETPEAEEGRKQILREYDLPNTEPTEFYPLESGEKTYMHCLCSN